MLIKNAQIITPNKPYQLGWLMVEDKHITGIGFDSPPETNGETIDANGLTLHPGFIDLHVHGAMGYEAMDASTDSLQEMAAFYARYGVTSFLPTTWTSSNERIMAALAQIKQLTGKPIDGATILGAHVEGPYLNPEKCGAQDLTQIRRADRREVQQILETGIVKLLALAPEYAENHWLITTCRDQGITTSAAHTDATYDDIETAVKLGLKQSTHTFNAMRGLHHREPGTVGAVLTMPQIYCEVITDGIHVHPGAVDLLFKTKGADKIMIITDAVRGAGLPDGSEYELDGRKVFLQDGSARLPDGTLAGSTLTFDRGVYNFLKYTHTSIEDVWPVSSLNAACAISVDQHKGSLEVGKDADCILVDDQMSVYLTMVEGRIVYQSSDFSK